MTKLKFILILPLMLILNGCWSIIGKEQRFVQNIELFDLNSIIIVSFVILGLIFSQFDQSGFWDFELFDFLKLIFELVIVVGVGFLLQFTILGALGIWIFYYITSWGVIGTILIV